MRRQHLFCLNASQVGNSHRPWDRGDNLVGAIDIVGQAQAGETNLSSLELVLAGTQMSEVWRP